METIFHIDISDGNFYYPLFYKLSFLSGFIIIMYIGIKRKYPLGAWILMNAIATVFGIIGSKVGTFGLEEWQLFLESGILPDTGRKTAFAGLLFGLFGLLISKRLLDFKAPVLDAYVWSVPVAIILQRIGCLFAGCCFGLPYAGPGAVSYENPGYLLYTQIESGLLNIGETQSLPVHNIPLYFILSSICILLIINFLNKNIQNKSALGFLGLGLVFGFRFLIEFLRDPASNHVLTSSYLGIKSIQWALLGSTFLLFGISYFLNSKKHPEQIVENPNKTAKGIAVLAFLVFILNGWFETAETIVIHAKLILSVLVIVALNFKIKTENPSWSPALLVVLSFFVMSQTYTFNDKSGDKFNSKAELRFTGGNIGSKELKCLQAEEGCFGPVCVLADTLRPTGPQYFSTSFLYENIRPGKGRGLIYGFGGNYERYYNSEMNFGRNFGNISGYLGLEGRKYFGIKAGLRIGKMYGSNVSFSNLFHFNSVNSDDTDSVYPTGSIWFGNKNYATIKTAVLENSFFGGSPSNLSFELKINTGRLLKSRFELLTLGLEDINFADTNWYAIGRIRLNNNYTLNPGFGIILNEDFANRTGSVFTLGVSKNLKK